MKIWAHRGCSQNYPENTLTAFAKAMELPHLTGIELDIQMTKDQELVVIHDEKVDRTTNGTGYVKDFTLAEIKKLEIGTGTCRKERIPLIDELLDLMQNRMESGLLLNIELKNSIIRYPGMEEKIVELIADRGMADRVVYSSFYAKSLEVIKKLEPEASVGILDSRVSDCLYKRNGGCGADALHPFWKGMDLTKKELYGTTVRAWFTGHLFPQKPTGTLLNLEELENQGITDVFLNEPERYL